MRAYIPEHMHYGEHSHAHIYIHELMYYGGQPSNTTRPYDLHSTANQQPLKLHAVTQSRTARALCMEVYCGHCTVVLLGEKVIVFLVFTFISGSSGQLNILNETVNFYFLYLFLTLIEII